MNIGAYVLAALAWFLVISLRQRVAALEYRVGVLERRKS